MHERIDRFGIEPVGRSTCSIRPACSTATRSASSSASSWSWVTKMLVRPSPVVQLAQPAAQLLAHLGVQRAERLVEQQQRGSIASARASATRWRWPPESWAGIAVAPVARAGPAPAVRRRAARIAPRPGARRAAAPAARRRCSRPPSCGGTGRSAGTRSRRRARGAGTPGIARHRTAIAPESATPARR